MGVVLVINILGIIGVLAVFTFNRFETVAYDFEKVDLEVITTGNVDIEAAENNVQYAASVSFRNLSSTPVLLRVMPVEEWTDVNGNVIPSGNIQMTFDSSVVNEVVNSANAGHVGRNWFRGNDGFFYYYEMLCPMETTSVLVTGYRINSVTGQYVRANLNLNFLAESVQAEGNVWSNFFDAANLPVVVVTNWNTGGIHRTTDLLGAPPRDVKDCRNL